MPRKALLLTSRSDNAEIEELLFSLGVELGATFYQRRSQPDPQLYLGSGKLTEARDAAHAMGVDIIVVNAPLKPGQIFNLQHFFEQGTRAAGREVRAFEVYDRTRLILEIFRSRARSPEARLQVELAQHHYEMPLVKEAINLQKKGERQAGMFGGGEYEVNQYYDMMKRRMARIRHDLDRMRDERDQRRKHRRRGGFHLVSLAGYTNAGKSSMLRALSDRETVIENRYFSTLSTKTARALSDKREILLTDTVGFIEDLPPWMIEAFHSTLEEIALSDIILLVLDASDPIDEIKRRLRSSLRILWEFDGKSTRNARSARDSGLDEMGSSRAAALTGGFGGIPYRRGLAPVVVALNKVDRISLDDLAAKRAALFNESLTTPELCVDVSAVTRQGLDGLFERLYTLIPDYDEYEIAIASTPAGEAFISWLHDAADVLDMTRGNEVHLHFEARRSRRAELLERLAAIGATALREVKRASAVPLVDNTPGPSADITSPEPARSADDQAVNVNDPVS